jgi:Galactose oxidase, central domain/Kelch motif
MMPPPQPSTDPTGPLPDRHRSAATWIVFSLVVVLATVASLLAVNVLNKLPTGSGPSPTPSVEASATSGSNATPRASSSASATPVEIRPASWTATGSMIEGRHGHTATLLADGRILVTGGCCSSGGGGLATAGLYNPSSGSWTPTGSMVEAREGHTATLLPDGHVLVAGGYGDSDPLASAELYDPSSGIWTATGNMATPRQDHTATLLPDGKVLVTGGVPGGGRDTLASAELYDPRSGEWTTTGSMLKARYGHTATLLPDGSVLVAGGFGSYSSIGSIGPLTSAERYDPGSGTWTSTGGMAMGRAGYTATLLRDGTVLVAGGTCHLSGGCVLASAEVYDHSSGSWTVTGTMAGVRGGHSATLLPDGKVLVAGGGNGSCAEPAPSCPSAGLASAELYDPRSRSWTATASMIGVRGGNTATLLPDGTVLVVGGGGLLVSAELYDPGSAK